MMMMRPLVGRIIAATLVVAATLPAAGAETCPTMADLNDGIRLSMADGSFDMVTQSRLSGGVTVTSIAQLQGGGTAKTQADYIHPLALPVVVNAQGPTYNSYEIAPDVLIHLEETREWSSAFAWVRNAEIVETGRHTSRLTGLGEMTIGACTYEVWRVHREIRYSDGFALFAEQVYAPSLGIILGESTLAEDGTVRGAVFFDQIAAQ